MTLEEATGGLPTQKRISRLALLGWYVHFLGMTADIFAGPVLLMDIQAMGYKNALLGFGCNKLKSSDGAGLLQTLQTTQPLATL